MPDKICTVDFAPYRFVLHFRPNLNLTPVPVSNPPTKDQCFQVFARLVHINPPHNADGTLRRNMDEYVATTKQFTLDLIRDATHARAIEEMEDEALKAYVTEGGTVTDWENLNVGCRVDHVLPDGNFDTHQPGYEGAYRAVAHEAIASAKAGTFRALMQQWWPGSPVL